MRILVILIALTLPAFSQRHKLEEIDAEKPGGKLLQEIMQENDEAKKEALMEQFIKEFPKIETSGYVLEQLQGLYVKTGDADRTIEIGERLLALDPDDSEAALQSLKAAEKKKDSALIRKWSDVTSAAARKTLAASKPEGTDDTAWKSNLEYAKQVDSYSDYALFAAASASTDPKVVIEFCELLEQRSPKGEYTAKARLPLFLAYRQTGAADKAVTVAEQVLATDQTNEDMLLVTADHYLQKNREPQKVHTYSAKIVEVMGSKPKPEGLADDAWEGRKKTITGIAHYMNGKLYFNENKYGPADESLRKALALVDANAALKAETLFLLGTSNYKMDKPQDAYDFFRTCSAIKSPFQAQATKNVAAMKAQYRGLK